MRILPLICLLSLLLSVDGLADAGASLQRGQRKWSQVQKFAYQLQDLDVDEASKSDHDLLIIDYSADGSHDGRFRSEQIRQLQSKPDGSRRLVLAYLSVGEAETYRFYWPGKRKAKRQGWLGSANFDWPGHYRVRYWDPGWKEYVNQYLDYVYAAGFDGVYLDRVDVYRELLPYKGHQPRQEMVALLHEIAGRSRRAMGSDFGVFIQNAEELFEEPAVIEILTGLGREDVYTTYEDRPRSDSSKIENDLKALLQAGKVVLCVDYPQSVEEEQAAKSQARASGFLHFSGFRSLGNLTGWVSR